MPATDDGSRHRSAHRKCDGCGHCQRRCLSRLCRLARPAPISIVAKSTKALLTGRIQMCKTNPSTAHIGLATHGRSIQIGSRQSHEVKCLCLRQGGEAVSPHSAIKLEREAWAEVVDLRQVFAEQYKERRVNIETPGLGRPRLLLIWHQRE